MPDLFGLTFANARTAWTGAGFTGAFSPATGQDELIVAFQDPTARACVPADSSIAVTS